jgi:hypothetical protein
MLDAAAGDGDEAPEAQGATTAAAMRQNATDRTGRMNNSPSNQAGLGEREGAGRPALIRENRSPISRNSMRLYHLPETESIARGSRWECEYGPRKSL